ncbi:MAG: hypothetical protein BWK73_29080 [Thiothrix lacustris]|uniref:Uncharacterized protein n=1 Tax=Thiothrix lacustris TaxID=525917 RepID=A0A1Y1QJT9_9GAMM|nr:MAG: hypothetical protein BWK73_29080 [Thiothrix lacustris]
MLKPADIRTRQDFVEYAGGVFQSHYHFKQWDSADKWKHFWSFFFDNEYGWVTSIYGTIPINELYQKQHHSIEHVIPRDFLDRYLARKGVPAMSVMVRPLTRSISPPRNAV